MTNIANPEADKPRLISAYSGMNILDARDHIRIVLTREPPKGVRYELKRAGFNPMPGDSATFFRTTNPQAIFDAQMIGATFFKETP